MASQASSTQCHNATLPSTRDLQGPVPPGYDERHSLVERGNAHAVYAAEEVRVGNLSAPLEVGVGGGCAQCSPMDHHQGALVHHFPSRAPCVGDTSSTTTVSHARISSGWTAPGPVGALSPDTRSPWEFLGFHPPTLHFPTMPRLCVLYVVALAETHA